MSDGMVALCRGQLGKKGVSGVDITVKSAAGEARSFAPNWEMVLGHKRGTLSDSDYRLMYWDILSMVTPDTWRWLRDRAVNMELRLLCYCADGHFCHTHVLIDYMLERWPNRFTDGR